MTLPWQGTTPEISSENDSRYETPGGAQNKVDTAYDILLNMLKLAVTGLNNGSEAAIARYSDPYGITYDWLKDRLDAADTREMQLGVNVKYLPAPYVSAVGDKVTSDSTAIQSAIDLISASGGGNVYLPDGSYLLTSTITLKAGVSLIGMGVSDFNERNKGTWLVASSLLPTAIQVGSGSLQIGCQINNLNITRQGFENGGSVSGVGLWERSSISFYSENIFIEGFETGILIGEETGVKCLNHYYVNTNVSECETFISVINAADVTFNGGRIGTNAEGAVRRSTGIKVSGSCDSIVFNRLIISHNGFMDYNVVITDTTVALFWIVFNDCDMETATVNSVFCDTDASMIRINNSWVGSESSMLFTRGDRIVIRDCTFPNQSGLPSIIHVSGTTSNMVIEDNDFKSNPNVSILVDTTSSNVTIKNNLIDRGGIGVKADTTTGQGRNLIILGNKITDQADNAIYISTSNFKNIKISQNIIEDYVNHGILVGGGTSAVYLSVQDNLIATSKAAGIARALIITSAVTNVMVTNNDMSKNTSAVVDNSVSPKLVTNNL